MKLRLRRVLVGGGMEGSFDMERGGWQEDEEEKEGGVVVGL